MCWLKRQPNTTQVQNLI